MISDVLGQRLKQWQLGYQSRRQAEEGLELALRQDEVEDCYQALRSLETWDRRVLENPIDAVAYGHRALVLSLLGRQAESRQDINRAAELGLDRHSLREEAQILGRVALEPAWVETFGDPQRGRRVFGLGLSNRLWGTIVALAAR